MPRLERLRLERVHYMPKVLEPGVLYASEAMTDKQRRFLTGLARAQPQWDLRQCPHAAELPALRWKLVNLQSFAQRRPADFAKQADLLMLKLK